jgi:hypothetical protein
MVQSGIPSAKYDLYHKVISCYETSRIITAAVAFILLHFRVTIGPTAQNIPGCRDSSVSTVAIFCVERQRRRGSVTGKGTDFSLNKAQTVLRPTRPLSNPLRG